MKKLLIILVCLLLVGCNNSDQVEKDKYDTYLTLYQSILNFDSKKDSSQSFDIQLVINRLGSNDYRYDIIIDNPKIAMYKIKVLAVIAGVGAKMDEENMMPSFGIFEDIEYNMVPGQIDMKNNFVAGINLSLISVESALTIGVMVEYVNKEQKIEREYLSLYAVYKE